MADASMNLLDELRKEGSGDLVREAMRWLVHELMEAEVTAMVEAGPYERTAERTTQ
ncbi:MAG: IS256 family transposase, partial [Betaproteobacteria bacterium]|nr:IS256 family transposase [Betaproteobacteria bacterium]